MNEQRRRGKFIRLNSVQLTAVPFALMEPELSHWRLDVLLPHSHNPAASPLSGCLYLIGFKTFPWNFQVDKQAGNKGGEKELACCFWFRHVSPVKDELRTSTCV